MLCSLGALGIGSVHVSVCLSVCLSVQAHHFLVKAGEDDFDMGAWYKELLELEAADQ